MEPNKHIGSFTLLLAIVAGYCDTATFVRGNATFSAHITGNFIIFAFQAVLGHDYSAFIKLISFPVFVLAVLLGGWLAGKARKPYLLLAVEGPVLLIAGFISTIGNTSLITYSSVMLTVFAMGFQNAFGRLFPKDIFGVTTMMTGNVTQAALDFGNLLNGNATRLPILANLGKDLVLILGFLAGCFLGGWLSKNFGLVALLAPGLAVIIGAVWSKISHPDIIPENLTSLTHI